MEEDPTAFVVPSGAPPISAPPSPPSNYVPIQARLGLPLGQATAYLPQVAQLRKAATPILKRINDTVGLNDLLNAINAIDETSKLLAQDVEDQRLYMREVQANGAIARRAIAQVRAYTLRSNLDPADSAQELQSLNDQLFALGMATSNNLSYSEYCERLQGIGIVNREACNDSNFYEVDEHEMHGWKGQYRMHVGRMFRAMETGGPPNGTGPCYQLDEMPPTPEQWLETSDAIYAPGPPLPQQLDVKARDDGDMLLATTLDQAVEDIVGPMADWVGNLEEKRAYAMKSTKETLQKLLLADRQRMLDPNRSWHAPWAFDFDGIAPSRVVSQVGDS